MVLFIKLIIQFSNVYGFYVLFMGIIVILMLTLQFLFTHADSCFALLLGFSHYYDVSRFCQCISGTGDIYYLLASVIFRNFLILHILEKTFILKMITFHGINFVQTPSFFTILYQVISAELFLMDAVLVCKILVYFFIIF